MLGPSHPKDMPTTKDQVTPDMIRRISAIVRDMRGAEGTPGRLSQGELARKLGLTQPTISDLESGKVGKLGIGVLLCLRRATNRSLDDLLGLSPVATHPDLRRLLEGVLAEVERTPPTLPPAQDRAPDTPPVRDSTRRVKKAGHR